MEAEPKKTTQTLTLFGLAVAGRLPLRLRLQSDRRAGLEAGFTWLTPILNLLALEIIMEIHGKGGRSRKMKSSDGSSKREVAEA